MIAKYEDRERQKILINLENPPIVLLSSHTSCSTAVKNNLYKWSLSWAESVEYEFLRKIAVTRLEPVQLEQEQLRQPVVHSHQSFINELSTCPFFIEKEAGVALFQIQIQNGSGYLVSAGRSRFQSGPSYPKQQRKQVKFSILLLLQISADDVIVTLETSSWSWKLGRDNFSRDQLATISVVVDRVRVGNRENTKRTRVLSKKRIYWSEWLEYLIPSVFQPCDNSLSSILVAKSCHQTNYKLGLNSKVSCPTMLSSFSPSR